MPKTKKGPTLKPGDLVYRVVERDTPDPAPHTWVVKFAVVRSCSDRQITLKGASAIGWWRTRFLPAALGSAFFTSEEAAVLDFVRRQRREVESAERAIKTAQRALAWVIELYPDMGANRG